MKIGAHDLTNILQENELGWLSEVNINKILVANQTYAKFSQTGKPWSFLLTNIW